MALPPFEKILNFRDVAGLINSSSQQKIKPGLLFRSATPDEATRSDRKRLVEDVGIKTIVDLRTRTEHINAAKKRSSAATLAQPAVAPVPDNFLTENFRVPGIKYADINLNGKGFERSLVWKLSFWSLFKMLTLMLFGYRMEAITIIGTQVLQPRGLIGLGIDTLDHSGQEIKEFFDVLSDEASWPVLIHCTQGKDRTGITVLLVLLLCGVDINPITTDYVRTEIELAPSRDDRLREAASIGLDEAFIRCPKDFPQRIRQHIEEKYGNLVMYLQGIGVGGEQLQKVRSILQAGT